MCQQAWGSPFFDVIVGEWDWDRPFLSEVLLTPPTRLALQCRQVWGSHIFDIDGFAIEASDTATCDLLCSAMGLPLQCQQAWGSPFYDFIVVEWDWGRSFLSEVLLTTPTRLPLQCRQAWGIHIFDINGFAIEASDTATCEFLCSPMGLPLLCQQAWGSPYLDVIVDTSVTGKAGTALHAVANSVRHRRALSIVVWRHRRGSLHMLPGTDRLDPAPDRCSNGHRYFDGGTLPNCRSNCSIMGGRYNFMHHHQGSA